MWNGTRLSLNAMPTRNKPLPSSNSRLGLVAASAESATEPLAPNKSAIPKSKKPDAIDERIKYLSADSRAVARTEIAHRQYRPSESNSRPRNTVISLPAPVTSLAPLALQRINAVEPAT